MVNKTTRLDFPRNLEQGHRIDWEKAQGEQPEGNNPNKQGFLPREKDIRSTDDTHWKREF